MSEAARGSTRSNRTRRGALVALLLAVGLLIRLVVAWRNLSSTLPTTLPDDAFYDFAIAHHIALGHPPSIDGVTPTNGYHPLWVALLTAVYAWTGNDLIKPLHWAMTLGALFDVAAALVLYRIALRLRLQFMTRLLLLGWFVLDPFEVSVATGGLESSLALALGLGLVWADLEYAAVRRRPFVYGAVAGLAILARTDQTILVLGLLAWRFFVPAGQDRSLRAAWAARVLAATGVVVFPWLVYSYATTGTIVQSSALALPYIVHTMPLADGHAHVTWLMSASRAFASTYEGVVRTARATGVGISGTVFGLAVVVAAVVLAGGHARRALLSRLCSVGGFPLAMLVLFVAHATVRMVYRGWYPPPVVAAWALVAATGFDHLLRFGRMRHALLGAVSAALAWQLYGSARHEIEYPEYGVASYSQPSPAPPGQHFAMSDCGQEAYFMVRGRTNIDGIVNREAFQALESGHLLAYLQKRQFTGIGASDYYHSHVYFGPRYRESLRRSDDNPWLTRLVADPAEKDALIPLSAAPVLLGSRTGREYLDDGWLWTEDGAGDGLAVSIGASSELLFAAHAAGGAAMELVVALRAAAVDPRSGVQTVEFSLNGAPIGIRGVKPSLDLYRLPAPKLRDGRNHLRLVYRSPHALPPPDRLDAWRFHYGNLVRAVDAGAFSLVDKRSLRLPPEGPDLSQTAGADILESGWLPVDRGATPAVWAVGNVARIRFWANAVDRAQKLTLRVGPPPPTASGAGQNIDLVLNGKSLGKIDLVPGEVDNYSVAVPAHALRADVNQLELHFARTAPDPAAGFSRSAYLFDLRLE